MKCWKTEDDLNKTWLMSVALVTFYLYLQLYELNWFNKLYMIWRKWIKEKKIKLQFLITIFIAVDTWWCMFSIAVTCCRQYNLQVQKSVHILLDFHFTYFWKSYQLSQLNWKVIKKTFLTKFFFCCNLILIDKIYPM